MEDKIKLSLQINAIDDYSLYLTFKKFNMKDVVPLNNAIDDLNGEFKIVFN